MKTFGYAAHSPDSPLVPYSFERRDLRENDVAMEVLYCGVCHSDLHMVQNDWDWTIYPIVPGHEIIGRVIATGSPAAIMERTKTDNLEDAFLALEDDAEGKEARHA